jgi:transposase
VTIPNEERATTPRDSSAETLASCFPGFFPGRPPVDDRACLTGIVFVLQSGIPWWMLPKEMNCGSGVTCWRRRRQWQRRGVWKRLLIELLGRLGREGKIDWTRAVLDSQSIRAVFGGPTRAKTRRTGPREAPSGTSLSMDGARP